MKMIKSLTLVSVLFCFISITLEGKESVHFNDNKLVKAILDTDTKFIANSFSPNVYFQYVVLLKKFDDNEFNKFKNNNGDLYNIFYDTKFMESNYGKNVKCLKEIIENVNMCSIFTNENDTKTLSSITVIYKNIFYDIVLNCNASESEIVGINISPAMNIENILFSVKTSDNISFQRLAKRKSLKESREWHSSGITQLVLNKDQSKDIYGPNSKFKVIYAGTDQGLGGVVYVLLDDSILMFQHLTTINNEIIKSYKNQKI